MGLLGVAWGLLKLRKAKELALTEKHVDDLVNRLQKAVIQVALSIQEVSWYRGLNVLLAMEKTHWAKVTDKIQEKIQDIFKNNSSGELYSAKFEEVWKSENTSWSNFAALFQKKELKKEKK